MIYMASVEKYCIGYTVIKIPVRKGGIEYFDNIALRYENIPCVFRIRRTTEIPYFGAYTSINTAFSQLSKMFSYTIISTNPPLYVIRRVIMDVYTKKIYNG